MEKQRTEIRYENTIPTGNALTRSCLFPNTRLLLCLFIIAAAAILKPFQLLGQSPVLETTVTILDHATNEPLELATYVVRSTISPKEQEPLAFGVSDENGQFTISIDRPVLITIQYLGHQTIIETLQPGISRLFRMEANAVNIDEVVVTGQFAPTEMRNSVFKVDVINRAQIEQKGAANLGDILSSELNIDMNEDDVFGSSISLQGIDGANVKILIDGVPTIGRLNNQLDVGQFNLNNVERIELIRGPLSVVYGTNALAGVINIITLKEQEYKLGINLCSQYESHGKYNLDGRLGYRFKNQFIQINGGRNFFDGFADPDTMRNMQWNPKEQYFGNALYTARFKQIAIRFQADYFREKILNRYDPVNTYSIIAKDDQYKTSRQNFVFSMEDNWKDSDHHFDVMASFSSYKRIKNSYFKNLVTLADNLTSDPADQDTSLIYQVNTRGSYSIESKEYKVSFQTGLDVNSEIFSGDRLLNEQQSIHDFALFSTIKYRPINQLVIQPGVRIAHNTKYEAPLTPALNIKYNIKNDFTIRASYGRGYRAPNLKELYLFFVDINHNIQGNDSLNAESAHNFQLDLSFLKRVKSQSFSFDTKFYFNSIKDRISLAYIDPNSSLYSYVNIYQSKSFGANFEVTYRYDHLTLNMGTALNWTSNTLSENQGQAQYVLHPHFKTEVQYHVPHWNLSLNFINKFSGKNTIYNVDETNASISETEIEAFSLMGFSAKKVFWDDRISLTAGLKNILGVTNIQTTGVDGGIHTGGSGIYPVSPGRVFFAKANFYFYK